MDEEKDLDNISISIEVEYIDSENNFDINASKKLFNLSKLFDYIDNNNSICDDNDICEIQSIYKIVENLQKDRSILFNKLRNSLRYTKELEKKLNEYTDSINTVNAPVVTDDKGNYDTWLDLADEQINTKKYNLICSKIFEYIPSNSSLSVNANKYFENENNNSSVFDGIKSELFKWNDRKKCMKANNNELIGNINEKLDEPNVMSQSTNKSKNITYYSLPEQDNSHLRLIGSWSANEKSLQDENYTIPVNKQYKNKNYPKGDEIEYNAGLNLKYNSKEELLEKERLLKLDYEKIRRAAEAHRQTRRYIQGILKPGLTTLEVVKLIETKSRDLVAANGILAGSAFPTGISLDNCAAHYSPNYSEEPVYLTENSVAKIDYGVHVGGRLVDCAFTVAFNEKFDPLVQATKEATECGIKVCGIDMKLSEIGEQIEEVIRSFELELEGKIYEIKPIENLSGHLIEPYRVHANKSVPIVKCYNNDRMLENEVYAIETFASTGQGHVWDGGACSHYMLDFDYASGAVSHSCRLQGAKNLLAGIKKNFSTLAFCRRWLDDLGYTKHLVNLKTLVNDRIVNAYPPLFDVPNSYTSQFEHTVILRPTCKEVVTRGEDY